MDTYSLEMISSDQHAMRMKRLFIGIGIACLALLILVIVIFAGHLSKGTSETALSTTVVPTIPDCSNQKANLLTNTPVALDSISTLTPLGNFNPPNQLIPTEYMYFNFVHVASGTVNGPVLTNIHSPADMIVTKITRIDHVNASVPFSSYRLDFTLCKDVTGYFVDITALTNKKLINAFTPPYDTVKKISDGTHDPDTWVGKTVHVQLASDEIIGSGGGKVNLPSGVGLSVSDDRVTLATFANEQHWKIDGGFVTCPLDYFPASLSGQLYQKIGDTSFHLVNPGEPRCGSIYQDKPGTLQGVWVNNTDDNATKDITDVSTQDEITLGTNNLNHTQEVFVLGNAVNTLGLDSSTIYVFTPSLSGKTNTDFGSVSSNGAISCYNTQPLNGGLSTPILLKLVDAQTMMIGAIHAKTCGKGPWIMPANSLTYVR